MHRSKIKTMCRYAKHPTKSHWVCLPCRYSVKELRVEDNKVCPRCTQPMWDAGQDFKPPRHRDVNAWRGVEAVYRSGRTYHSCGCGGPGWRPHTAAEARQESMLRPWKPRHR